MKMQPSGVAIALTMASIATAAARPPLRGLKNTGALIFEENFDVGTQPNPSVWTYDIGASGWGNQELQRYTDRPENVRVEGGNLIIQGRLDSSGAITSGRIHTQDKVTFQYGSIEARMKLPDLSNGLWPAFWTLGNNFPVVGWPFCGELDILEMGNGTAVEGGFVNRQTTSAAHWAGEGERRTYAVHQLLPGNQVMNDGNFHLFRMDWSKTLVETFVDNRRVFTFDISTETCIDCEEFHQPHYMLLNMAVGGTFTNIFDAGGITAISSTKQPQYVIDYIRIYANADTVVGGSVLTGPVVKDCGCGSVCDDAALDQVLPDGTTCRSKINSFMSIMDVPLEQEACRAIGDSFPDSCGATCHPSSCQPPEFVVVIDCGRPDTCTSAILNQDVTDFAGTYSRIARIRWLMANVDQTQTQACQEIANVFPDPFAQGCNPSGGSSSGGGGGGGGGTVSTSVTCGCPSTCTNSILSTVTPGYDGEGNYITPAFAERVEYFMSPDRGSAQLSENEACAAVVDEFASISVLGACDPRKPCGPPPPTTPTTVTCGCSATCTSSVLSTVTPGYDGEGNYITPTFSSRVEYLSSPDRGGDQKSEADACSFVVDEFASIPVLSACDPRIACPNTGGGGRSITPSDGSVICGCANTCTSSVLDTVTTTYDSDGSLITPTIFERITYLMNSKSKSETEACQIVVGEVIADVPVAAGCNPTTTCPPTTPSDGSIDCGCPNSCTAAVLNQPSIGYDSSGLPISPSLFERISYVKGSFDEVTACQIVADEFPAIASDCNPSSCQTVFYNAPPPVESIDCGCPNTCSQASLGIKYTDSVNGFHSCGARISWTMWAENLSEKAACQFIYDESLTSADGIACDPGCNPMTC